MRAILHHIAANIDRDVITTAGVCIVIEAEQFGRVTEPQVTFFGQFPHQGGVKIFANLDTAAGQVPAGNIGVPDQKHPSLPVKSHGPHTERMSP